MKIKLVTDFDIKIYSYHIGNLKRVKWKKLELERNRNKTNLVFSWRLFLSDETFNDAVDDIGALIVILKKSLKGLCFCGTNLPLASTRWTRLTLSNHCPLF